MTVRGRTEPENDGLSSIRYSRSARVREHDVAGDVQAEHCHSDFVPWIAVTRKLNHDYGSDGHHGICERYQSMH